MTTSIIDVTLDGVTDVNIFGAVWEWYDEYISALDLHFDDGNPATTDYVLNLSLEGNFLTNAFTTWADGTPVNLNVTDANDGGQRDIFYFRATTNGGNVTAVIEYTNIDYFVAYDHGNVDLTLGDIEINNVRLDGGADYVLLQGDSAEIDTLETRSNTDEVVLSGDGARVRLMSMGDGNDTLRVVGEDARVDSVDMGEGNDLLRLTGVNTRVEYAHLDDGNDKVVLTADGARMDLLHLGSGNDTLDLRENTRVGAVESYEGNKTVDIAAGARIDQLEVGGEAGDTNTITVAENGFLKSFTSGQATNNLTILGGADQLSLGDGTNTLVTGTDWIGTVLSTGGDNTVTVNGGEIRTIGFSGGVDTIAVHDGGRINALDVGGNDDSLLVDGDSRVSSANLGDGNNTISVTGTDSQIDALTTYDGDDSLLVDDGARVSTVSMGGGDNDVEVKGTSSRIEALIAYDGDDTVRIRDGAPNDGSYQGNEILSMQLGHGENRVYLNAYTWVNSLETGRDTDRIWLYADDAGVGAQAEFIKTSSGDDVVRLNGDAWVETIKTGDDADTILLNDESHVNYLTMGEGNDSLTSANGYQGEIRTNDGNDMVDINGGANLIHTGADNDTVTTGDEWVFGIRLGDGDDLVQQGAGGGDIIRAGNGNDTVELGAGGVRMARLGDGDDVIRLTELPADWSVVIQGGSGIDEADFSAFSVGIDLDRRDSGYQNIAPDIAGDPTAGYFSLVGIENLTGTAQDDSLRGHGLDNVIEAGKGDDKVWGYEGADYIIGGAGKDTLWGGEDADTFYFKSGHGTKDRIKDFDVTEDVIDFREASNLADIVLTQTGSDVWVESLTDGVRVRVEDVVVADMNNDDVFGF